MTTLVSIANEVLELLGYSPGIDSLEENSDAARSVKRLIFPAIRKVLNEWPWQEATKEIDLPPQSTNQETNESKYFRPGDTIRIIKPSMDTFRIEGNYLIAPGTESVSVKYIFNNTNPASWSVDLTECVKLMLAADLSKALLKNPEMSQMFFQELKRDRLPEAKKRQMQEKRSPQYLQRNSNYIKARGNGTGWET